MNITSSNHYPITDSEAASRYKKIEDYVATLGEHIESLAHIQETLEKRKGNPFYKKLPGSSHDIPDAMQETKSIRTNLEKEESWISGGYSVKDRGAQNFVFHSDEAIQSHIDKTSQLLEKIQGDIESRENKIQEQLLRDLENPNTISKALARTNPNELTLGHMELAIRTLKEKRYHIKEAFKPLYNILLLQRDQLAVEAQTSLDKNHTEHK